MELQIETNQNNGNNNAKSSGPKTIHPLARTAKEFLELNIPEQKPLIEGLVHQRDMIAFGGRRRHGKTTFMFNLALAGAAGLPEFIGYPISSQFRTLLFFLEDDEGGLQDKLKKMANVVAPNEAVRIVTRNDFLRKKITIRFDDTDFQKTVVADIESHKPDLIIFDNLSLIVAGQFNDHDVIQKLMGQCYEWTQKYNAAVLIAAHPKKQSPDKPVTLDKGDPELYMEQLMGSSIFINSTGCLWAIERRPEQEDALFLGGRQRADGSQNLLYLEIDKNEWFHACNNVDKQLQRVNKSQKRKDAWTALPAEYTYLEGQNAVAGHLSASSFHAWHSQLLVAKAVVKDGDKYQKTVKGTRICFN